MPGLMALPIFSLLSLLAGAVGAQGQDSERERLGAERQGLLARFAAEERACSERFAVTACVDDLCIRRRAALEPLRARELALDDADREQRARDRQAARATRTARASGAQPASAARFTTASDPETAASRPAPAVTATVREPDARRAADSHHSRALQAAERARAAAQRARTVDDKQAELARKQAERAASGKAASALPVPAVASAAAR